MEQRSFLFSNTVCNVWFVGDIARMYGSIIPKVVMTLSWVETVATPVSVIMWTCGGIKLPTSPNLENFFLKNGKKESKHVCKCIYSNT